MEQRELGRSGIHVSQLILGCGNFGGIGSDLTTRGKGTPPDEAFAIMDDAWAAGITTFDTASSYGGGESEQLIGRWRASRMPEGLVLSSKVFWPVREGDDQGLAPERVRRVVAESSERLGVERVDMYLPHEPDPATPLLDTLRAFDELVRDGAIGAFGVSNAGAEYVEGCLRIADAHGLRRIEWVQNEYSLLVRDAERDVIPLCASEGLGFTPFSPLAGGWLTGKYRRGAAFAPDSRMALRPDPRFPREDVYDVVDRLVARAHSLGVEPATLALAWVLAHPHVTAALAGPSRRAHLAPMLAALELDLGAADRAELAEVAA
jgi:aryl-alcohol dehydrogenase-like predicted oxidoreductase